MLLEGVSQYLEKMLMVLEGLEDDIEVKKVSVQVDHVHVIAVIPPRVSVARVVQYMKSMTGRLLKEKYDFMKKAIHGRGGIWSRGYCVSSIGLNEKAITSYVEYQGREDKGQLKLKFGK